MKKRAGRPRLGTQNARGVLMAIRFTPDEARQIQSAAKRSGLTKSDFIRKSLLKSADMVNV
jgi:uncharacterized protein (DUF1778 family)